MSGPKARPIALIVAPHPDDEIVGAAAMIALLVRAKISVRVLIVTDGGGSHRNSILWPRERLVSERKRESRRALRRLGVLPQAIDFLGLRDGELADTSPEWRRTFRRALRRLGRIALIVSPSPDDDHPDHVAVAHALATQSVGARRLSYRVWPHTKTRSGSARVVAKSFAWKRSLIASHRTQLGAIRDDPDGFAIAPHELRAFGHPVERFETIRR